MWLVSVYSVDRAYGGPEEGGWWYDTGQLERTVAAFRSLDKAVRYCERLTQKLSRLNAGKYPPNSVLSRGDWLDAMIHRRVAPTYFPSARPIFE